MIINKIRKIVFDFIRKHFWGDDYDINEEFSCGNCGKEMYRRYLFCSIKCEQEFDIKVERGEL